MIMTMIRFAILGFHPQVSTSLPNILGEVDIFFFSQTSFLEGCSPFAALNRLDRWSGFSWFVKGKSPPSSPSTTPASCHMDVPANIRGSLEIQLVQCLSSPLPKSLSLLLTASPGVLASLSSPLLATVLHWRSAVSRIVLNQGGLLKDSLQWGQIPNTRPPVFFLPFFWRSIWGAVRWQSGGSLWAEFTLFVKRRSFQNKLLKKVAQLPCCEAHFMSSLEDQKDCFLLIALSEYLDGLFCS